MELEAAQKLVERIGNDFPRGRQVDFVLGKWQAQEMPVVNKKIEKCCEVIESFAALGLEKTMAMVNNLRFE